MDNLTDKQLKFIDAYFKEQNIDNICKRLDITRATYYNYINDINVKQEINRLRHEMISNTTLFLQTCLNECSKELYNIIKDDATTPQTKINAINSVFANCNKLTEQVDILEKLNQIEQKLQEVYNEND